MALGRCAEQARPDICDEDRPGRLPQRARSEQPPGRSPITFGTAWDYDNQSLTYEVLRDNVTVINTATVKTNFWTLPSRTVTDTVTAGTTHTYQVRIKDPFGNTLLSPKSNSVKA